MKNSSERLMIQIEAALQILEALHRSLAQHIEPEQLHQTHDHPDEDERQTELFFNDDLPF